jgi:hypothetical protein
LWHGKDASKWDHLYDTDFYGLGDHVLASNTSGVCQWKPSIPTGTYDVYVCRSPHAGSRRLFDRDGERHRERRVPSARELVWGVWTKLGTWSLNGSTALLRLTANAPQSVAADAVKFVQVGP